MPKTKTRPRLAGRLKRGLESSWFFTVTLFGFVLSASWIALSARYPMAFDEGYHLGIIQLYAKQWSPFFSVQPAGTASFGALTRDPSYLYHWLMSFPYRLIAYLNGSFMIQVIALRLLNVALFALGLVLMRRVLLHTKASAAVVNVVLLFVVLIPVTPLLAAHINYDNLLIPLTALSLLLTMRAVKEIKLERLFPFGMLVATLSVAMLASLVKFAFLPILTAIVAYLAFELYRARGLGLKRKFRRAVVAMGVMPMAAWLVLFSLSLGLFLNTYGVNIVKYHNPVPQCGQVLSVQQCQSYAPWARNYADALYNKGVNANPLRFSISWLQGMFNRLFFTINGPGNPNSNENHIAPVFAIAAATVAGLGLLLFAWFSPRILKRDTLLGFLLFVSLVYCSALWGRNYHDFLHLGKMVAINGRYLIPIIFPVCLAAALGYQELFGNRESLKLPLLGIVLILSLSGGGALSYIHYSNATWYWPEDRFARQVNHALQRSTNLLFFSRRI